MSEYNFNTICPRCKQDTFSPVDGSCPCEDSKATNGRMQRLVWPVIALIEFTDDREEFIDITTGYISKIIIHSETITCKDERGRVVGQETVKYPWRFKQSWIDSLGNKPDPKHDNSDPYCECRVCEFHAGHEDDKPNSALEVTP